MFIISFAILGIFLYLETRDSVEGQMIEQAENELNTIEHIIGNQLSVAKSVKEEMENHTYLQLTVWQNLYKMIQVYCLLKTW